MPCSVVEIFPELETQDWETPIANELKNPFGAATLNKLKHFTIYQGVLYFRGSRGLLARFVGTEEAKVKIKERRTARAYDALVKPRQFAADDLVFKAAPHVMRGVFASKFAVKWEGPFLVKEANANGYYRISRLNSETTMAPINSRWLKAYHP
ncbi:hypothetical protein Vadar_013581 [Vaccinium darrowii]|uniref:Uncharacterized protein n=1 Tax=Vaccinium darrowii TaxID=229202 RepID=A0ACB7X9K7_9ERIC|nr:hypothetical protein Vadar_013581 [Vaccinium darrowii]